MLITAPSDIVKYICSYCSLLDRLSLSLCSKKLYSIVDFQNDPIFTIVKTNSWKTIPKQVIITCIGTHSYRNLKFLLKYVKEGSEEQWTVIYYSAKASDCLKFKKLTTTYCNLMQKNLFGLPKKVIIPCHVGYITSKKLTSAALNLFPHKFRDDVTEHCVKIFMYEKNYSLVDEWMSSTKTAGQKRHILNRTRHIHLLHQDFARFEGSLPQIEECDEWCKNDDRHCAHRLRFVRLIYLAIKEFLECENPLIYHIPTPDEKRNVMFYFQDHQNYLDKEEIYLESHWTKLMDG